jgi:Bacterial PH domain
MRWGQSSRRASRIALAPVVTKERLPGRRRPVTLISDGVGRRRVTLGRPRDEARFGTWGGRRARPAVAADLAYGAAALPAVCAGIAWAGVFASIRGDKFGRAVAVTFVASGLSWVVWRLVGSGLWYEDDALVTRGVFRTRRIPWSSIARACQVDDEPWWLFLSRVSDTRTRLPLELTDGSVIYPFAMQCNGSADRARRTGRRINRRAARARQPVPAGPVSSPTVSTADNPARWS